MNILMLIGITVIAAYYMGHVVKKVRLPSIIGYMVVGVLLGTSCFGFFDDTKLEELGFITEIALGFVAFSIGLELSMASLKRQGIGIVSIIFAESFAAFFVVTIAIYAVTKDFPMALIFGAMAPASAPAGTVAVIHECKAKGSLTKALYAVVGFDDGLAIIIFGFAASLAKSFLVAEATGVGGSLLPGLLRAGEEIGLSLLVGGVIGFAFCQLIRFVREERDILVLAFGAIAIAIGLSTKWHLSLILTNMVIGFTMVNTRKGDLVRAVSKQLLNLMPLLFILFFSLAGAHLHLSSLKSLGLIGVVYVIGRSVGLIGGSRLGAMIGNVEEKVKKYVGMGILSQAGVAIGLSLIVKHEFVEIGTAHADKIGTAVLTTITATCIFFEIIGPILTKIALSKAGEISADPVK